MGPICDIVLLTMVNVLSSDICSQCRIITIIVIIISILPVASAAKKLFQRATTYAADTKEQNEILLCYSPFVLATENHTLVNTDLNDHRSRVQERGNIVMKKEKKEVEEVCSSSDTPVVLHFPFMRKIIIVRMELCDFCL